MRIYVDAIVCVSDLSKTLNMHGGMATRARHSAYSQTQTTPTTTRRNESCRITMLSPDTRHHTTSDFVVVVVNVVLSVDKRKSH